MTRKAMKRAAAEAEKEWLRTLTPAQRKSVSPKTKRTDIWVRGQRERYIEGRYYPRAVGA